MCLGGVPRGSDPSKASMSQEKRMERGSSGEGNQNKGSE